MRNIFIIRNFTFKTRRDKQNLLGLIKKINQDIITKLRASILKLEMITKRKLYTSKLYTEVNMYIVIHRPQLNSKDESNDYNSDFNMFPNGVYCLYKL